MLVYGTLRHGEGNYSWCLNGRTSEEVRVNVIGMEMHGDTGFPYVFQADQAESTIVAELMTLNEDVYEDAMRDLDRLEGYRGPGMNNHSPTSTASIASDQHDKAPHSDPSAGLCRAEVFEDQASGWAFALARGAACGEPNLIYPVCESERRNSFSVSGRIQMMFLTYLKSPSVESGLGMSVNGA